MSADLSRRAFLGAAGAGLILTAHACKQTKGTTTSMNTNATRMLDLAIIGGGPAGLSAALVAGRAKLNTLVIDENAPRNAVTHATHGLFTRDGTPPGELRRIGREQLAPYATVRFEEGRAQSLTPEDDGTFLIRTKRGSQVRAKRVLLATGWRDDLASLGLPGLSAVYGTSVFPCPFCDGFELSKKKLAIFVGETTEVGLEHYLAMVSVLSSPNYSVFANGNSIPKSVAQALEKHGNALVSARVTKLESADGHLTRVLTEDGRSVPCEAGFVVGDYAQPSTPFANELGVAEVSDPRGWTLPATEPDGSTSVPGFYIAGDARVGFGGLATAVAQGSQCAARIVAAIAMERWHG